MLPAADNKEREMPMFWGIGHGFMLLPLFLLGRVFFWVILVLLILALIRRFASRNRHWYPPYQWPVYKHWHSYQWPGYNPGVPPTPPFPNPGMPPTQLSALEILRQRYARGEIDAATFDQMRERLEASGGPGQQ
jgi:putative membrane protein